MPYARMMISYDGYLIPMDDQYFRIDPQNLGFKYGGEITCVGMITNIIGADTNPNDPKNMLLRFNLWLIRHCAKSYLQIKKICALSIQ